MSRTSAVVWNSKEPPARNSVSIVREKFKKSMIILSIIGIVISLLVIRPKFSDPCGAKDWDALYGWTLNLGGKNVPWMFIWGIIYGIFGWYSWPAVFIMLPAIMLIWVGPRKYEW